MISVVILDSKDKTYLVRCLNAIRRQRYQNFEIILVGCQNLLEMEEENKVVYACDTMCACKKAKGEYILFCSMSEVLAPNVLEALVEKSSKEEIGYIANCMVSDKNNFVSYTLVFNIYAKLFPCDMVLRSLRDDDNQLDSGGLVVEYFNRYSDIRVLEDVYIYETNPKILDPIVPLGDGREWLAKTTVLPERELITLAFAWIEQGQEISEIGARILQVAEKLPNIKELHYQIAKRYLSVWYRLVLRENDDSLYKILQTYFKCLLPDEAFQSVIAGACGLGEKQLVCLKKYNLADYQFYYNKLADPQNFMVYVTAIEALETRTNELQGQLYNSLGRVAAIEALETRTNELQGQLYNSLGRVAALEARSSTIDVHAPGVQETVLNELRGPALADYVISSYLQGALGAGTIIKSLLAWVKFKIRIK